MTDSATIIEVEGLSKLYRLGTKEQRHENLASALIDFIRSPIRNYRYYRSLYDFRDIDASAGAEGDNNGADVIWALRDVSFELRRGEALGIIGPNGAGKSTLLKILSRITPPTKGEVRIRGKVSSLLEVGTGFHPELTGRENVYLNGTILGMRTKEVDRKFDEIVEFSGVERFLDTPVKRYSSGMSVRLAFAVAAHLEPDILIVDEVLAVGDAAFQKKCLGKMEDVMRQGRTILFVSHNMGAISNLCASAICLSNGQVTMRGNVDEVVAAYLATTSNVAITDPRDWKREGTGEARITAVHLLDAGGSMRNTFQMGETICVEFEVEVYQDFKSLPDDLAVQVIRPDIGQAVLHLTNQDDNFLTDGIKKGMHRFRVEIPGCLLYPGNYNISIFVAGFDWVKDVLSFNMEQSSVSPRTYPFYRNLGIYHSPSKWSVVARSPAGRKASGKVRGIS